MSISELKGKQMKKMIFKKLMLENQQVLDQLTDIVIMRYN